MEVGTTIFSHAMGTYAIRIHTATVDLYKEVHSLTVLQHKKAVYVLKLAIYIELLKNSYSALSPTNSYINWCKAKKLFKELLF